jgi:cellulose synthase operon protein C
MRYRPGSRYLLPLLLVAMLPVAACAQQDGAAADAAYREGRYDDAIRIAGSASQGDTPDSQAHRTLARALMEVGRYDDVIEAARDLHNLRGEALRARGRLDEAEEAFRQAVAEGGEDLRTAEFNLAELMFLRGQRGDAIAAFDQFIDVYNRSDRLASADLVAVGNAVRYLAVNDPELFQDAVKAFDDATREDPTDIEPHIRIGELLLEKYNGLEARQALTDALALNAGHPRALLAMAKAHVFDGQRGEAVELVEQALEINPNLVAARVFLAETLLDVEDHERAEEELLQALDVNPSSLEALSVLGGLYYIRDDERRYEEMRAQVQRLNPGYAGFNAKVADLAAKQRRYADAATLAEEGVRIDPQAWDVHGILGLNLFRLGRIEEAFRSLETAFAGDPYNVWIKNNLDLLDTFAEYEILTVDGFEFMLHSDEADLLLPYLAEAAAEAHTALSTRYGDRARGRIRIELYPHSTDFSVRTVGLAGLGALGVSFGDVLALDSPAARQPGSYNWLTTLWHEMAHTITLGVSNSRVPRWLTEGMSVVEERRALPGWENRITPEFLLAYGEGELPPVSRLNEGFIRPATPQHLGHAYDMASLVVEWVEEKHGFDALIRMLHGYRDGRSTEEIFRSVLDSDPEDVDDEFDDWLRAKADPDDAREYRALFIEGQQQLQEGNMREARRLLEAAAELFPVARSGSPYRLLAQIELRENDEAAAIEALERLTAFDETAYAENLELARLLEATGDPAGAVEALERAVWIFPYEMEPHVKLAALAMAVEDHARAVRERRAVVALRPTDQASALYELARALFAAGDLEGARTEVLRALEAAPAFEEAQQLLLQIHERS